MPAFLLVFEIRALKYFWPKSANLSSFSLLMRAKITSFASSFTFNCDMTSSMFGSLLNGATATLYCI